jgi:hypothetical protein
MNLDCRVLDVVSPERTSTGTGAHYCVTSAIARALGGTDIGMPVGLVVSALYYWLVCRPLDIAGGISRIPELDRGLDSG